MLSDHFSFMEDSWLVLQRNRLLINVLLVSGEFDQSRWYLYFVFSMRNT